MATATASPRFTGFKVLCAQCGNPDSHVRMDLNTLKCSCSECDEEYTPAEAVKHLATQLARWEAVARWVELAPGAVADGD